MTDEHDAPGLIDEESRQAVRPAGKFRIYLGSAAGVGKTCAMLDEGWRRHHRGSDVVIGYVETHGRPHTAELIRDLEVVPRKSVEYRGTRFEEMDLAAVLARRPEVVLIDELAHTNVPGSGPHAKRWEDVLELFEDGIAVVSTLNIQHLESHRRRSGGRSPAWPIRERVPDWVVRKADQLELIDSSADQLRRRMLHGNIYPPEKVPDALAGFFKTQNLVALRELALRFVADETEEELLRFLEAQRPPRDMGDDRADHGRGDRCPGQRRGDPAGRAAWRHGSRATSWCSTSHRGGPPRLGRGARRAAAAWSTTSGGRGTR